MGLVADMKSAISHGIDWSKQHCGVHQAPWHEFCNLMPTVSAMVADTFPLAEDVHDYTWDVKVHMLMPRQYPCIPHWHVDNIPRVNGIQQFDQAKPELPMWLWVSGAPLTQFEDGYLAAGVWHRFTQMDKHRGSPAAEHGWRGFIRATHKDIQAPKERNWLRRHSQVYLDAETYEW